MKNIHSKGVPRVKNTLGYRRAITLLVSLLLLSSMVFSGGYIQASDYEVTQSVKAPINFSNEPLFKVISAIESETKYKFYYNSKIIDTKQLVSLKVVNGNMDAAIAKMFQATDIAYKIMGNDIVLSRKTDKEPSTSTNSEHTVKGMVVDADKLELIGVTITIKGETIGTVSDIDGKYELRIPARVKDPVLVFYQLGLQKKEIRVANQSEINVTLVDDTKLLDEVVVVGYGVQKKVNLTGAVTQLNADELKDRPVTNMTQLLQGEIPNLNITTGSGKPGEGGSLNIRGTTSINGGGPLVLIDGMPGDMDRINPSDVESVSVLKDASAAAIYGARAAFGVILITTKSAKEGKPTIKYSNNFGWMTHSVKTDFINSGFWNGKLNDIAMYNSLGITAMGYSDEDYDELWSRIDDTTEHPDRPWVVVKPNKAGKDMYNYYGNFDWYNYLYSKWRTKSNHNVNLTGSSADSKFRYMISTAYNTEEGIIKINPDNYDRYNLRTKFDAKVTKWLTVTSNTSFFKSRYKWTGKSDNFNKNTSTVTTNPIYFYHPAYVPINPDGSVTGYTGKNNYQIGYGNHANWLYGKSKGRKDDSDFLTIFDMKADVFEGFTVTANYAYEQISSTYQYRQVEVPYSLYPGETGIFTLADLNQDKMTDASSNTYRNMFNLFGNYNKSFGNHNIGATVGFNQEWQKYKIITARGRNLLSEDLNDLSLVTTDKEVEGNQQDWAIRGAFLRLNYDYNSRYLIEFSGRYDGSSRFAKQNRFAFFPSFSLGWRLSEEAFMDFLKPTFDNIKVRYSYGSLGNQLTSDNYGYIEKMAVTNPSYLINGEKINVTNVAGIVPRRYTWEKAITNNVGLDIDMLNSRLSLQTDFYIRQTKDMLAPSRIRPAVLGAQPPKENAADLETKGFEVSLSWQDKFNLANKPFNYRVRATLSDYTAKITKFDNPTNNISDYYVGKKVGEIWGYKYGGIFQSDEEAAAWASIVNQDKINKRRVAAPTDELRRLQAGDIKILDLNGDGEINTGLNTLENPGDRTVIGNTTPRYAYGLSLGADWNGIDLSVFFQGIGRKDWYPHAEAQMFWQMYARPYTSFIPKNFMKDIWTPENPDAYFPMLRGYIAQNSELSVANDMYLQNLAYCKLKNITIGYTLPRNILNKTKFINNFRMYISGENLITWTKLKSKYIDPESVMSDPTGRAYPMNRIVSFGVDITF